MRLVAKLVEKGRARWTAYGVELRDLEEEKTKMEIIIGILLLLLLFALVHKRSHPAAPKGWRGVLARPCPSCRTYINNRAAYCPHCAQPTGR